VIVVETDRLALRRVDEGDAASILELMNEPDYLRFIGDRGVRTLDDARAFVETRFVASYVVNGFGLYAVERRDDAAWLGVCGLVKRDSLDDVDLGFAFLERYRGMGYAYEAAEAIVDHARDALGLARLAAITTPDNVPSIALLEKLGFRFVRTVTIGGDELKLFLRSAE
jgi:RimJ/RimL family protein N-acetyltransferase